MQDDDKRQAALAAVGEVRDGMLIGLGTGSTACHAIAAIGELVRGGMALRAVATSDASARQALGLGIPLLEMGEVPLVDLTIDGADEIDDGCRAIKGAGGAMTREKIVATASRRMIVVADGTKHVTRLGVAPVPVEVLPFARAFVARRLEALGGEVTLRRKDGADYRTDDGNPVLDTRFAQLHPDELRRHLDALPGVVGHGLFVDEVDAAYIATDGIVTKLERTPRGR